MKPSPLPPLSPQFTTADARLAGVSTKRLRASDLDRRLHGVRHSGDAPPTLIERCRMLSLRAPDHAFFSHSTAALLWGAPLPWALELEPKLHVSVIAPHSRLHSRDLIGHRLDVAADDVTEWGGLRLTTPARTWFDVAGQLGLGDLVAVGDYLVHHRAPLTSREEMARMLGAATGTRGVKLARRALSLVNERAESRPESLLRVIIVTSDLPEPEVNHSIMDTSTGQVMRPDFRFPAQRVLLEYQGDYHLTKSQRRRDMTRRSRLEALGWRVMELNADDLKDPAELVARIRAVLALASVPIVPNGGPR